MGVLLGLIHWLVAVPLLIFLLGFATPVGMFLLVGALIPAAIAKSKQKSFLLWYGYGINLWIVALIHALVLERPPQTVIVEHRGANPTTVDDQAVVAALNGQNALTPAQLAPGQSMRWRTMPVRNEGGALQVQAGGTWRSVSDQAALDYALDQAGAPQRA